MSFEASTRRFENTSRATSESFLSAGDLLDLASVLQCPISGSKLHVLSPVEIASVRSRLVRGELEHAAGAPVQMEIDQALASENGELIYPIADGILILVPAFAIVKPGSAPRFEADAAGVMRFYDEIGWNVTHEGVFEDTVRFEDLREITRPYVKASYARVGSIIEGSGKYLLDVACGPIPYAEYLTYSESYGKRLCVDLSVVALRAARKRLRDKGIYIQADITQLPFRAGTLDAFISLHTIYHVPASRQALAFRELERVVKPGGRGVVVYSWGSRAMAMDVLMALGRPLFTAKSLVRRVLPDTLVQRLKSALGRQGSNPAASGSEPGLYFEPHDQAWFDREIAVSPGWEIRVWRTASAPFLSHCVHPGAIGRGIVRALLSVEQAFPRFCGRFGQYPMFVYRKPQRRGE